MASFLLLCGDARRKLQTLPSESVQCVVTSPPYWNLRDYGLTPLVLDADERCAHEWGEEGRSSQRQRNGERGGLHANRMMNKLEANITLNPKTGTFCRHCPAWRGSLGLEPTPDLYVRHLVTVFREVRRVLRDDGVLWLNLGDSYSVGPSGRRDHGVANSGSKLGPKRDGIPGGTQITASANRRCPPGLKPKDLCMISALVAMALRTDGWWLRSMMPWLKRNPMPESTTDRPNVSVEYVFLLSKSKTYYYDHIAVQQQGTSGPSDLKRWPSRRAESAASTQAWTTRCPKPTAPQKLGKSVRSVRRCEIGELLIRSSEASQS